MIMLNVSNISRSRVVLVSSVSSKWKLKYPVRMTSTGTQAISLQQVTELLEEHSCRKLISLGGRLSVDHDKLDAAFPE